MPEGQRDNDKLAVGNGVRRPAVLYKSTWKWSKQLCRKDTA